MTGLASSAFARHYSRNHGCFLFLWVLRCFTSPRSLYPPYIFRRESPGRHAAQRGFPIRTSSDHSVLIHSPRLIADCYVLLRLQMPRHPPFALKDLKSHEFKSKNRTDPKADHHLRLRCSRPLCSSQNTGGTMITLQVMQDFHGPEEKPPHHQGVSVWSLRTQQRAHSPDPPPSRSQHPKMPY